MLVQSPGEAVPHLPSLRLLGKGESLERGILHTHKSIPVAVFRLAPPLRAPPVARRFLLPEGKPRGRRERGSALPSGPGSGETIASLGFPFLSGLHLWRHSVVSVDEPRCPVHKTGAFVCAWGRWGIPQD